MSKTWINKLTTGGDPRTVQLKPNSINQGNKYKIMNNILISLITAIIIYIVIIIKLNI